MPRGGAVNRLFGYVHAGATVQLPTPGGGGGGDDDPTLTAGGEARAPRLGAAAAGGGVLRAEEGDGAACPLREVDSLVR